VQTVEHGQLAKRRGRAGSPWPAAGIASVWGYMLISLREELTALVWRRPEAWSRRMRVAPVESVVNSPVSPISLSSAEASTVRSVRVLGAG
jgi:hypothetical protein